MNTTGMIKEGALKNKTILITGGGTGLGKSMGQYFMELGANIIITSRKQEVLDQTAMEFNNYSGKVLPIAGDVRKANEVQDIIEGSFAKKSIQPFLSQNCLIISKLFCDILCSLLKPPIFSAQFKAL